MWLFCSAYQTYNFALPLWQAFFLQCLFFLLNEAFISGEKWTHGYSRHPFDIQILHWSHLTSVCWRLPTRKQAGIGPVIFTFLFARRSHTTDTDLRLQSPSFRSAEVFCSLCGTVELTTKLIGELYGFLQISLLVPLLIFVQRYAFLFYFPILVCCSRDGISWTRC